MVNQNYDKKGIRILEFTPREQTAAELANVPIPVASADVVAGYLALRASGQVELHQRILDENCGEWTPESRAAMFNAIDLGKLAKDVAAIGNVILSEEVAGFLDSVTQ